MARAPSPQQLRYLISLDELRHFGRAANACAVSQSTLSAGLHALEQTLDVRILDRAAGRRIAFTAAGTEIVARAREALAALDRVAEAASRARAPMSGPLRLGVIPTIGPFVLASLMPALAETFPRLRPSVREETSARLLARLGDGSLDLALLAFPYERLEGAETLTLWRDEIAVALPPGHRLLALPEVPVASLAGERMLLLDDEHCLRGHALRICGRQAAEYGSEAGDEGIAANSLHTLVQMVSAGLGIALVPRLALRHVPPVETRPVASRGAWRSIGLAWRRGDGRAEEYRSLGRMLEALFAAERRAEEGAAGRGG